MDDRQELLESPQDQRLCFIEYQSLLASGDRAGAELGHLASIPRQSHARELRQVT